MSEHHHWNVTVFPAPQQATRIRLVATEIRMTTELGRLVAGYNLSTFMHEFLKARSRQRNRDYMFILKPHLESAAAETWPSVCGSINPPRHAKGAWVIQFGIQDLDWTARIGDYQTLVIGNGRLDSSPLYESQRKWGNGCGHEVMYQVRSEMYLITGVRELNGGLQICKTGDEKAVAWITNAGEMGFNLVDDETGKKLEKEKRTRAKLLLFSGLAALKLLADRGTAVPSQASTKDGKQVCR
ncbi:hypothetical protein DFH06DRAFT_1348962 [Mycena polygramma]|nr:hypothetical protein DFH06DRAFT_1348962 [Mycena polygramma]